MENYKQKENFFSVFQEGDEEGDLPLLLLLFDRLVRPENPSRDSDSALAFLFCCLIDFPFSSPFFPLALRVWMEEKCRDDDEGWKSKNLKWENFWLVQLPWQPSKPSAIRSKTQIFNHFFCTFHLARTLHFVASFRFLFQFEDFFFVSLPPNFSHQASKLQLKNFSSLHAKTFTLDWTFQLQKLTMTERIHPSRHVHATRNGISLGHHTDQRTTSFAYVRAIKKRPGRDNGNKRKKKRVGKTGLPS